MLRLKLVKELLKLNNNFILAIYKLEERLIAYFFTLMSMPGIIMQIIASLLVGPLWNMENISNSDNAVPLNINSDRIIKV
mgnify:CR=1 FL=1